MKNRFLLLAIFTVLLISFLAGCATAPKSIPKAYFQQDYDMTVEVVNCPEKPKLMDSGKGGLIGLLVNAARASEMRKKLEGIKGDTVSELIRQKISEKLEDYFDVVDEQASLSTEIKIIQWGWFVPTTMFGIKKGSYQFRIIGEVQVYDQDNGERKLITSTLAMSEQPMGNDPEKDIAQEALIKAVEDFSEKIVSTILANGA